MRFEVLCSDFDFSRLPFDTQFCMLTLTTAQYSPSEMRLAWTDIDVHRADEYWKHWSTGQWAIRAIDYTEAVVNNGAVRASAARMWPTAHTVHSLSTVTALHTVLDFRVH